MNYSANEIKLIEAVESRVTKQRLLNVLSHGDIELDPNNGSCYQRNVKRH